MKKCGCNPTGFRQWGVRRRAQKGKKDEEKRAEQEKILSEEERIEDKGVRISDINIFCNSTGIKKQAVGWATIGFKAYQGSFLWKEDPTLRKA